MSKLERLHHCPFGDSDLFGEMLFPQRFELIVIKRRAQSNSFLILIY